MFDVFVLVSVLSEGHIKNENEQLISIKIRMMDILVEQ